MSDLAAMQGHKRRIYDAVSAANGAVVSFDDLLDTMYGDREDGGPLSARRVLYIMAHKLMRDGVPLICHYGRGYSLGGERSGLSPLEETLLSLLLTERGRVVSYERIANAFWPPGERPTGWGNVLRVTASHLRRKTGFRIDVKYEVGYFLASDEATYCCVCNRPQRDDEGFSTTTHGSVCGSCVDALVTDCLDRRAA